MKQSMLDTVGGEDGLRKLVNDFYDIVERIPEGEVITKLHLRGHGLDHVRLEQFNFLSGFLGGRRYYEEKHRHMNVKLMHEHVPITQKDAEDWLTCMDKALGENNLHGTEVDKLRQVFRRIALLLVNDLAEWGVKPS